MRLFYIYSILRPSFFYLHERFFLLSYCLHILFSSCIASDEHDSTTYQFKYTIDDTIQQPVYALSIRLLYTFFRSFRSACLVIVSFIEIVQCSQIAHLVAKVPPHTYHSTNYNSI